MKDSNAYKLITNYYGDQTAERSGVRYMDHIDDALTIFDLIDASVLARKAFCVHPLLQPDEGLEKNWKKVCLAVGTPIVLLAMEYRYIAMSYLSQRVINNLDEIKLSPLKDVNDMLIADKVQNKKDFMKYHYGTHERSEELLQYFDNWLERLNAVSVYNQYVTTLN